MVLNEKIPIVDYDFENGFLKISGRSYPEYPEQFYEKINDKLKDFKTEKINVIMYFEYINTSSTKCIFKLLKKIQEKFLNINIKWMCDEDDYDIINLGEIFSDTLNIPFEIIENYEDI